MILELIVNVLFTQDALKGIALVCRQRRVRKRVMVNDGKGCSTIGANCFSHFSILLGIFSPTRIALCWLISCCSFRPPLVFW